MTDPKEAARRVAAVAAVERLESGMTIGLGSGRAVWRTIDAIRERWPGGIPLRATVASSLTEEVARAAGIELISLDDAHSLDLAIDGADEVDPQLGLIKGGGGALLREKLVVVSARRFIVVAETDKQVSRLGETRGVPVEVVRFGWHCTMERLLAAGVPSADLRVLDDGTQFITDEGHLILDCAVPPDGALHDFALTLKAQTGVVEHGLFLGMTHEVLLGAPDGSLVELGG